MKALTLKQPWASLVVDHGKDVENRVWNTSFRGDFLIHAGTSCDGAYVDSAFEQARLIDRRIPLDFVFPLGGIIGIATLVDVVPPNSTLGGRWHFRDQYGFVLDNVRPLPFFACRGMQKFWGDFNVVAGEVKQNVK